MRRPKDWLAWVNQPVTLGELGDTGEVEALRRSVNRGTPFGAGAWVVRTAEQLGLQATLGPRGRPRKKDVEAGRK